MAAKEIPQLGQELFELSKGYLMQETVEPAKQLGKVAGISLAGGALLAFGFLFVVLGANQLFLTLFDDGRLWVALASLLTAIVALAIAGLVGWRASK
jgi:Putative Actinobacterial Holin-X, holin superfamily III